MYQARSLIGSDASGLSDPFARVIIGEYCKTTQVNLRWELLCSCKARPLHFLPLKTHFSFPVTFTGDWWDAVPNLGWIAGIWRSTCLWTQRRYKNQPSNCDNWNLWSRQGIHNNNIIRTGFIFTRVQLWIVLKFPKNVWIWSLNHCNDC